MKFSALITTIGSMFNATPAQEMERLKRSAERTAMHRSTASPEARYRSRPPQTDAGFKRAAKKRRNQIRNRLAHR